MFFLVRIWKWVCLQRFHRALSHFNRADEAGKCQILPQLINLGFDSGQYIPLGVSSMILGCDLYYWDTRDKAFRFAQGYTSSILGFRVTRFGIMSELPREDLEWIAALPVEGKSTVYFRDFISTAKTLLATT